MEAEKPGEAAAGVQVTRMMLALKWRPRGEERRNDHRQDVFFESQSPQICCWIGNVRKEGKELGFLQSWLEQLGE